MLSCCCGLKHDARLRIIFTYGAQVNGKLIFFVILLLTFDVRAQLFICSDAEGNLTYQQKECPLPPSNPALRPVSATQLDKSVVQKTVNLFRQAFDGKDISAHDRLLSRDFVFVSTEKTLEGKILFNQNKAAFQKMSRRMFPAITANEPIIQSSEIKLEDNHGQMTSVIRERVTMGKKVMEQIVLEIIKIKIVDGKAVIFELRQVEHYR